MQRKHNFLVSDVKPIECNGVKKPVIVLAREQCHHDNFVGLLVALLCFMMRAHTPSDQVGCLQSWMILCANGTDVSDLFWPPAVSLRLRRSRCQGVLR